MNTWLKATLTFIFLGSMSLSAMDFPWNTPNTTELINNMTTHDGQFVTVVQPADQVVIKQVPGKQNTYTIKFRNVNPDVTIVSQGPHKIAGKMSTAEFIRAWNRSNTTGGSQITGATGALVIDQVKGSKNAFDYAIQLTNPEYNARTHTITYTAEILKGSDRLENGSFESPILLIDGLGNNQSLLQLFQ